jgi:hypothetical protein
MTIQILRMKPEEQEEGSRKNLHGKSVMDLCGLSSAEDYWGSSRSSMVTLKGRKGY